MKRILLFVCIQFFLLASFAGETINFCKSWKFHLGDAGKGANPAILNGSRRQRIAKGRGTNIQEVNRLLKQFDQTRKMMKMVTGSKMGKMMPKLKR